MCRGDSQDVLYHGGMYCKTCCCIWPGPQSAAVPKFFCVCAHCKHVDTVLASGGTELKVVS